MTLFPRSSGILLHPTSLPGAYGIGDLGEWAYRFADWLAETGQTIWQVLPLGPTGYGDSPYQTLSAFAGNPNLISLNKLVEAGWLTKADLSDAPDFPADRVDYGWIIPYHDEKLALAYQGFLKNGTNEQKQAFYEWCAGNIHWLNAYTLFITLKDLHKGRPWVEWKKELALRDKDALAAAREKYHAQIHEKQFRQWIFYSQWLELKTYVNKKGIRLFGDIPIFVAHDSADVWANQDEYDLDENGNPKFVAGVPPDYFSPTGQRWGNPLYHWDVMRAKGYNWWIDRFKGILSLVDYIRIDHFRGFEAYWQIPASEETAVKGEWIPGPGADFFHTVKNALGELPIIAEDLGVITAGVIALRNEFGLPGMRILQFAWSDPTNNFLPHRHGENTVVYTGTHDNNTTIGWWREETDEQSRQFIQDYIGNEIQEINWTLIRLALRSVAHTCVIPLQDVLGLGADARMNTPSIPGGNWQWRFTPQALDTPEKERLAHLTWLYQRRADQRETDAP